MVKEKKWDLGSDNPYDIVNTLQTGWWDCIQAPINLAQKGQIIELAMTKKASKIFGCNGPKLLFELDFIEKGEFRDSRWYRQQTYKFRIHLARDLNGIVIARFDSHMSDADRRNHRVFQTAFREIK